MNLATFLKNGFPTGCEFQAGVNELSRGFRYHDKKDSQPVVNFS